MHKILGNLLGVALIIIVVFKIVLKDLPDFFYFDSEIRDILVNISLSYVAAYIFYLIQVYLPETKKRMMYLSSIKKPMIDIQRHIRDIFRVFDINLDEIKNDNDFENIIQRFSEIDMMADSRAIKLVNGHIQYWNKIQSIEFTRQDIIECAEHCQKIYSLDIEINDLLYDIKVCHLMKTNNELYKIFSGGTSMSIKGDSYKHTIREFYDLYRKLECFVEKVEFELGKYKDF
ncbi:hypothetical protein [Lysinibacillus sp. OTC-L20]|uniref:hypothetical protein n=1 Tax=Lysinibacillus sp. OTC-L20 TaxID=3342791 RepID=UPI0035BAD7A4